MAAFVCLPCSLPQRPSLSSQSLKPRAPRASAAPTPTPPSVGAAFSRRSVLSGAALAALAVALPGAARAEEFSTPAGVKVRVLKKGTGPKIEVGDLTALRFKGSYGGFAFDDIFDTPQPYFYRAGSEALLKVCWSLFSGFCTPASMHSRVLIFPP